MPNNRGKITNKERARQQRDYSGLRFRNITPTDIDGVIEYHNKAYVIMEFKYGTAEISFGQKLALERLTDDLERSGKPTICIIASHNTHDPNEDIDAANASVIEYRLKGEWFSPELILTTKKVTELFLDNLEMESEDFHLLLRTVLTTIVNQYLKTHDWMTIDDISDSHFLEMMKKAGIKGMNIQALRKGIPR